MSALGLSVAVAEVVIVVAAVVGVLWWVRRSRESMLLSELLPGDHADCKGHRVMIEMFIRERRTEDSGGELRGVVFFDQEYHSQVVCGSWDMPVSRVTRTPCAWLEIAFPDGAIYQARSQRGRIPPDATVSPAADALGRCCDRDPEPGMKYRWMMLDRAQSPWFRAPLEVAV